jgi:hypothetical protein
MNCLCGCGNSLQSLRKGAKFFTPACRSRYHKSTHAPRRPFVALDGEGIQDRYVLLAVHEGDTGRSKAIKAKEGLSTEECLDFLLSLPRGDYKGRKPIYVWFAFDYDVNMMLKDVPLKGENSIEQLKNTNHIRWRGYRISYIRRKILRVSKQSRRHTSFDVWGYFQSSFESALANWGIESTDLLRLGKASRTDFGKWSLSKLEKYNQDELVRLAELAERLRDSVLPLELPVQSWHGPAALAGSWLQKNKARDFYREIPTNLLDITFRAYFGGRIDVAGYGIVNPVYHYDIVSAYPSAIRYLPDLTKLTWVLRREYPPSGRIYVARIKWKIPTTYWGVFPWRDKHGSILWPLEGEGWYWNSEVEAAIAKFGLDCFDLQEVWVAEGDYHYPFKNLIEEAFRYRQQLKAENHPSHVAVKLVLNSLYGKFAQTVGSARYYSPIWAGLITSHTRAQLATAMTDDVVCVMTDSIWSSKPLDLPIGTFLGEWEQQEEKTLYLAEAGLYQAEKPDGTKYVWQRGFDKRNPVDIQGIVSNWIGDDPSYTASYEVSRFIGMGLAVMTHYPWRHWVTINRKIEPVPIVGTTKRLPSHPTEEPHSDFVWLQPRPRDENELSYPYAKLTLDPAVIEARLEDECEE